MYTSLSINHSNQQTIKIKSLYFSIRSLSEVFMFTVHSSLIPNARPEHDFLSRFGAGLRFPGQIFPSHTSEIGQILTIYIENLSIPNFLLTVTVSRRKDSR
ncbi:hypothetical protein N7G274_007733 [Stereocaulon virgatum]|uniref:Uncharacterized protein n=1 Tax=Stereocaulon virgatum TaxID=373712 RepID=A0ABR4A2E1_9LECA